MNYIEFCKKRDEKHMDHAVTLVETPDPVYVAIKEDEHYEDPTCIDLAPNAEAQEDEDLSEPAAEDTREDRVGGACLGDTPTGRAPNTASQQARGSAGSSGEHLHAPVQASGTSEPSAKVSKRKRKAEQAKQEWRRHQWSGSGPQTHLGQDNADRARAKKIRRARAGKGPITMPRPYRADLLAALERRSC